MNESPTLVFRALGALLTYPRAELRDALFKLDDARVVVLTGEGRGFCAGQDLNDRNVAPGEAVDRLHRSADPSIPG